MNVDLVPEGSAVVHVDDLLSLSEAEPHRGGWAATVIRSKVLPRMRQTYVSFIRLLLITYDYPTFQGTPVRLGTVGSELLSGVVFPSSRRYLKVS